MSTVTVLSEDVMYNPTRKGNCVVLFVFVISYGKIKIKGRNTVKSKYENREVLLSQVFIITCTL